MPVTAAAHIVPLMPPGDVVALAVRAEQLGYDTCLIADEGFHPDIYACLGAIAVNTDRIQIGVMTNAYTRHPAVSAAALATINELSGGRVVATLLAGGSMVLAPMGIERRRPYRHLADMVEALRLLWSGEPVTWEGETCALEGAQLGLGPQSIPIWVAGRGPMVLGLAGRSCDGAVMTVKPDLAAAFAIVAEAAATAGHPEPARMYLGRICYTPALFEQQRRTLSYVLMDSPRRALESLDMSADAMATIEQAAITNDASAVDPLVTDDLLRRYQIAGSPTECSTQVRELAQQHRLSRVLVDVLSADLDENLAVLEDSFPIVTGQL